MRCPECGQKECCGASLSVERDRYREALERIAQKDYHSVTNNTRGEFGWIAEQALRGGEE